MSKTTKTVYIILLLFAAIMINFTSAPTLSKIAVIGVAVFGVGALLMTPTSGGK